MLHQIRDFVNDHALVRGGVEDTRLEAKAKAKDTKKIRGEGQGQPFRGQTFSRPRPSTKDTAQSVLQKKVFKKVFQAISTSLAQPEFLIGGPKPQITCNDVIKDFQTRNFLWDKDIVGWKI